MLRVNITMQNIERLTLEQIREFVEGSRTIGFAAPRLPIKIRRIPS